MSSNKNMSSGAKKAEKLAEDSQNKETSKKTESQKNTAKNINKNDGATKNKTTRQKSEKTTKTDAKNLKRQEKKEKAAQLKEQRRQERLDKKMERRQKLSDARIERAERAQAKRQAKRERKELLKSKTRLELRELKMEERQAKREAKLAKREAAANERQAKREHKLKLRAERRERENDRRHAPGFGGWLAAVISLGVTTLALGTIMTFGWMNMNGLQSAMGDSQVETLYELNSIVDNLDANLSKARATTSTGDTVRVLSDIAIESEMAEVVLERLPLGITFTEEMASFINKMGDSAQNMLYTVATSGELTPSQQKSLQYMYQTNLAIKRELNEIVSNTKSTDLFNAMRGKGGVLSESFTNIQNNVIEDPKGIQDGPFADSKQNIGANALNGLKEITAPEAEKLAKEYFADYKISDVRCTGEVVANSITCYNVQLVTADGEMLAQLSKNGGKVVMFDSYKDCTDKNFSVERCVDIAEDFLSGLGYGQLKAVWTSENGTTCNLNFAPVTNGVILYPDLIKVKVCEQRGIVTGLEAISYCLNHGEREELNATISKDVAQSKISGDLNVELARLALIPFNGEEVLTYEFYGTMGESEYYVYVDAQTGEEIEVLTVVGTAQGRALM